MAKFEFDLTPFELFDMVKDAKSEEKIKLDNNTQDFLNLLVEDIMSAAEQGKTEVTWSTKKLVSQMNIVSTEAKDIIGKATGFLESNTVFGVDTDYEYNNDVEEKILIIDWHEETVKRRILNNKFKEVYYADDSKVKCLPYVKKIKLLEKLGIIIADGKWYKRSNVVIDGGIVQNTYRNHRYLDDFYYITTELNDILKEQYPHNNIIGVYFSNLYSDPDYIYTDTNNLKYYVPMKEDK